MATTTHVNGSHLVDETVAHANLTYQKQTLLNLNHLNKRNLERQLSMLTALIVMTIKIQ